MSRNQKPRTISELVIHSLGTPKGEFRDVQDVDRMHGPERDPVPSQTDPTRSPVPREDPMKIITWAIALAAVALPTLLLSGCAGFTGDLQGNTPGMASYEINRTPAGDCRVRISSGREIAVGSIKVGRDCTLEAKAKSMTGADVQAQSIDAIRSLIEVVK